LDGSDENNVDIDVEEVAVKLQDTNLAGSQQPSGDSEGAGPSTSLGMEALVSVLSDNVALPGRDVSGPFLFSVDHCFPIKGKGTVITGTVLNGSVQLQQNIELSSLRISKKVKSMQVFHKGVSKISQGDRAGICLSGLDAKLVERGFASTPGSVPLVHKALVLVKKVRFFRGTCLSESKVHVSVGHSTVMAKVHFFGALELPTSGRTDENANISSSCEGTAALPGCEVV
jgi:selenocysteine-specific elongation factor